MLSRNGKTYFTEKELRCKDSGKLVLAPGFAERLLDLRTILGKPMAVTSCCRSKEHNFNVGGNPRSFHVCDFPYYPTGGTCAIDIACTDAMDRADLVMAAIASNWWVGINKTFVHLDRRMDYGIARDTGIFLY